MRYYLAPPSNPAKCSSLQSRSHPSDFPAGPLATHTYSIYVPLVFSRRSHSLAGILTVSVHSERIRLGFLDECVFIGVIVTPVKLLDQNVSFQTLRDKNRHSTSLSREVVA